MNWKYEATKKQAGPIDVFINFEDGRTRELINSGIHSPDGFQMGYGGSGPADLAYSILVDYNNRKEGKFTKSEIENLYQKFKEDFIVPAKESLSINDKDIEAWLNTKINSY